MKTVISIFYMPIDQLLRGILLNYHLPYAFANDKVDFIIWGWMP